MPAEVTSWPGVEARPGRRGEFSRVDRREIRHLHGDSAAHFSFPKQIWAELFRAGADRVPPSLPGQNGLRRRRIRSDEDVADVIALMRLDYERIVRRHRVPA